MIICPSCQTHYDDDQTRFCGRCGSDLSRLAAARTAQNPTIQDEARDRLIGATVDGRYRVIAKIGAGGMGAVYKVEHLAMGKLAAMKVLHSSLTQDREVAQRFKREAEAVSRLSSPNTVQVFTSANRAARCTSSWSWSKARTSAPSCGATGRCCSRGWRRC